MLAIRSANIASKLAPTKKRPGIAAEAGESIGVSNGPA